MPAFLISYDLRKQRNYQPLYDLLGQWQVAPLLESVWLANLNAGAGQVRDMLMRVTDGDDGVAVIEIASRADWAVARARAEGIAFLRAVNP